MCVRYGIGVGSSGPLAGALVDDAIRSLSSASALRVLAVSDRYASPAAGGVTDAPFVNAALLVESALSPRALLGTLRALERRFGRVRGARWGGRSLDLDLLWSSGLPLATPELVVPHPRLEERAFALLPLLEALARARCPLPQTLLDAARAHALSPLRRLPGTRAAAPADP